MHIPGIAFRTNKRSAYKGSVISNVFFCRLSSFIISFRFRKVGSESPPPSHIPSNCTVPGFNLLKQDIACENIRFSSLLVAEDVSRGGTSATQRQKFHTDDVKSVQNPVRSADWSMEKLHCFSYCLQMTDKRQKAKKVKCKHEESLTKQSIFVQYSLL